MKKNTSHTIFVSIEKYFYAEQLELLELHLIETLTAYTMEGIKLELERVNKAIRSLILIDEPKGVNEKEFSLVMDLLKAWQQELNRKLIVKP